MRYFLIIIILAFTCKSSAQKTILLSSDTCINKGKYFRNYSDPLWGNIQISVRKISGILNGDVVYLQRKGGRGYYNIDSLNLVDVGLQSKVFRNAFVDRITFVRSGWAQVSIIKIYCTQ